MSNETAAVKTPVETPLPKLFQSPVVIERNGQSVTLQLDKFGKKSDFYGQSFLKPVLKTPTIREVEVDGVVQKVLTDISDLLWAGIGDVIDAYNVDVRVIFADIYVDNIDAETGLFDEVSYLAACKDFTAGVAKLSQIDDQLEALFEIQTALIDSPEYGDTDSSGQQTPASLAIEEKLRANNLKIKPLKLKKADITAKYEAASIKRKASKEAKEAKAKAAAANKPAEVVAA
jgi:hypothetical protein